MLRFRHLPTVCMSFPVLNQNQDVNSSLGPILDFLSTFSCNQVNAKKSPESFSDNLYEIKHIHGFAETFKVVVLPLSSPFSEYN